MDDQMRILIQDHNRMEEKLKQELHFVKLQLNHSIKSQTVIQENVNTLQQTFKQRESQLLNDFSNLRKLKDKLENKLHAQDQSIQTVHMMLKPKKLCEQYSEIAIGAQNPFYLRKAKVAQPTLYDGNEIINPDHDPTNVPSSEEDLELAELARQKMHEKMNDPVCVEKRIKYIPPNYSKENFLATFTPQTQLTPEQVFWSIDLEKRKAEELKANTPPLPVLPPATVVQKSLVTEVRAMKAVFENMEAEVDQNAVDKKCGEIERRNLLIMNENLIAECLSKDVFYTATDSVLNVSRFSDMHDALTIAQSELPPESENFNLRNKIQNDDHDSMIKHFSKLEVEHFNLQLKYQNLKERFGNKKPVTSSDAPSFDSLFNKDLTAKLNALHDLNERYRAENAKVKQHYKELYDSIKITRAKTTDQNKSLLSEIENLKAQLKDNSKCVTIPDSKPKVLAPGRYPIDVEPIPPRHKNNREVHLHYIKHLKENVETLREIVEDAKVERPLDTSLASACRYTKHSQELLEYVIGTYPKDFSPSNKQNASTTSLRKKRVTFVEPCETSTHNTPPQVEHQKINLTNAPGIPSTGVKGASAASRSKPRSNTKKDRTLPAKSALKQVEAHSRMNKLNEKQKNRVDSSISYKRTVINSNPNTSCKTCNKCLISVNHDHVCASEVFGEHPLPLKLLPLGDQWPLTRNTPPKVLPTKQWKPTGRLLPLGRQCPLVRSTALKSDCMPADPQETIAPVVQIVLWYLDSGCSKHMTGDRSRLRNFVVQIDLLYLDSGCLKHMTGNRSRLRNFVKKFIGTVSLRNDHLVQLIAYSEITHVYAETRWCLDLIKDVPGTNLYTISVEDMMRSSPICLLSKALQEQILVMASPPESLKHWHPQ
ncbi:hypothetical protein Tco_1002381 [Tanacetum coccineum]|uniref:Integrase, catalytic region, zinc finger, CCHC-type, peptidase aspartic, catalytic n=1 Tax=Tanacetum coccineum TaxID=301880 RepID=A0ABQ5F7K4_9ASTR